MTNNIFSNFYYIQSLNPGNKILILCSHNLILLKVKEEFEVFDNCAPVLVYSHPLGPHKTFYKVSPFLVIFRYVYWFSAMTLYLNAALFNAKLPITAQNLARKSSMCTAWQTWLSLSRWSTFPYQTALNSKYPSSCLLEHYFLWFLFCFDRKLSVSTVNTFHWTSYAKYLNYLP